MANTNKTGVYQSPLSKLYARQQPKIKVSKGMRQLLLLYSENDHRRIAQLLTKWLQQP